MPNTLHVRERGKWDLVANLGTAVNLMAFALHFPGKHWEVRNEDGEIVVYGFTKRRPE